MKRNYSEWDQEKKIRRVEKGTDKSGKHRKSIYNMLSELDESDSDGSESYHSYASNCNYDRKR